MERISTAAGYQSALLNIMTAESRENTLQQQVSTGYNASNLEGYGAQADTLTATQSLQSRINSYLDNTQALSSTLTVQNQALGQVATSAQSAGQAVTEAIATGSADGLMTSLQGFLSQAVDALNTNYAGNYMFAGSQTQTSPIAGGLTMSQLGTAGSIPALFSNDQTPTVSRLDDNTTVTTGFLASNLGSPLFQALQAVQQLNSGPNGPLSGNLTTAQQTALQALIPQFNAVYDGLNTAVAQNGGIQQQVTAAQTSLTDRQTALTGVVSNITNVDMAQAASNLQLSQTALQASAHVFSTLQSASLLSALVPSATSAA